MFAIGQAKSAAQQFVDQAAKWAASAGKKQVISKVILSALSYFALKIQTAD